MEATVCTSSVTTASVTTTASSAELTEFNMQSLDNQINDINKSLTCLNKRCEQFNDVKQSIRTMNDLIKDDLYSDFGTIAVMMRAKLDEVSDKIKERLKDAYSVIRDTQTKISNKINEIKNLATQIEILKHELANAAHSTTTSTSTTIDTSTTDNNELKLKTINMKMDILNKIQSAQEQINVLNKELRIICDPVLPDKLG
jgi:chromosome segregation ATPase